MEMKEEVVTEFFRTKFICSLKKKTTNFDLIYFHKTLIFKIQIPFNSSLRMWCPCPEGRRVEGILSSRSRGPHCCIDREPQKHRENSVGSLWPTDTYILS